MNLKELPDNSLLIWKYFIDLNNTRPSGMGVSPISYSEMYSYFKLYDISIMDYEIEAIHRLDVIALAHYASLQKAEESKNKSK